MMRFVKVRATELAPLLCCLLAATLVHSEYPAFRHPSELFRWSKCVYHNVQYNAGDFVKTGEPCLNCTCSNGAIVCHLRMCAPIPNPPPPGCFILHKRNMCCPELVCTDDNNILLDGLEGRSRPGSNDDTELDVANLTKFKNKGCVINGTSYADGSALSSSTDCRYCFCLKGQEECMKPNCILQLTGCTPLFNKHTCCPVKYNCHGSDNVTIISTEFPPSTRMPPFESTKQFSSSSTTSHQFAPDTKSSGLTTARMMSTTRMISDEVLSTLHGNQRENPETSSVPFENNVVSTTAHSSTVGSSSTFSPTEPVKFTEETASDESITEISTIISLIKTGVTLQEGDLESQSVVEERRNTFADSNGTLYSDSTQPYQRTSPLNVTTVKTIPREIETILNITKKDEEGNFELDYDEPTLPPSLPNLKIIPFVAADALDKPKDVTIEHREDVFVTSDVTDTILDSSMSQPGQFSPPVKTEGGFVPRDPILDGPYFASNYNSVYQHQATDNTDMVPPEQASLPSITEPPKIVDKVVCTNGYLTYRHGELISEPKACNMCLCLYGEIVCQKPACAPVQAGCYRAQYDDVTKCCGEVVCGDSPSTTTTESEKVAIITAPPPLSPLVSPAASNVTTNQITIDSHFDTLTLPEILTVPPAVPTIMTIKVKSKNDTNINHKYKITVVSRNNSILIPSTTSTTSSTSTTTTTTTTTPQPILSTTEKSVDPDYDGEGFSFENMLSFLFDDSSTQKAKNGSNVASQGASSIPTSTTTTTTTIATTSRPVSVIALLTTRITTEASTPEHEKIESNTSTSAQPINQETDSAIYVIKNDNQFSKNIVNYTDEQVNTIKEINTYYVPPLGNFEEVILNPTKKPVGVSKKPVKANPFFSTTLRPRHTTAKVIPLSRPSEISTPQTMAGDPGAASGLLKLSGCNIFGRMYRLGKIIAELSGPCLQCMCADIGVHCVPLKC